MRLDYRSPTALYVQLADILRRQIESGELNGRLPSVKTLAQEYEVAVGTVNHALAVLRKEGLVVSAQGRGYYTT